MSQRIGNQDKLASTALAAGMAFAARGSAEGHQVTTQVRTSTMPRLALFGFALALIACTQQSGREEMVSAAQPRDEAAHVAPPSAAPQLRDEPVPRAAQPRDEAVHVPPPSLPQ
jgi:hypothetical protein